MSNILWVGVGFDPEEDGYDFGKALDLITGFDREVSAVTTTFPSGARINAQTTPELGTVIDIFDGLNSRVGFGIRVGSVTEGKEKLSKAEEWLRAKGIVLPVSVYAWSPDEDISARSQT